ncbi:MAG: transcriptional regulator [Oscillospiraceae bacterium]|nr:transcriptional regulator [Oscillospiraceae bacterium]
MAKMNIEQAWEFLFDRHNVIDKVNVDGLFRISATEINTIKEARLMAKFDQSSQLPQIFQKNKLSILPVTRGEYVIGRFATHKRVVYPAVKPIPVEIPSLQTLDYTNLYSEAAALLFAYNSGIIKDIMGNSNISFTVNGRMSSGSFEYKIEDFLNPKNTNKICVQNAQVEIDAGYESADAFCICEAKNVAAEEILIRQLYYPYRLWSAKISKPVIPVFLVFSNDVFHAFVYKFEDMYNYNSIKLLTHKAYTFANEDILLSEVIDLWKTTTRYTEPQITFPQADSFERVVDLMSVLADGGLTRDEVSLKYEFDGRQTNYYISITRQTNDLRNYEYIQLINK